MKTTSSKNINVSYEATPNPQSMKFNLSAKICDENLEFSTPLEAERSPLASKIFGFPWTDGVYLGQTFITITKQEWVDWDILKDPLCQLIKEHIETDQEVLLPEPEKMNEDSENDSEVVKQIKHILNTEIRPFVMMDGGDIVFNRYENNIVYIHMKGACSGCPSSTMTLKNGVEARLIEKIPEIKEVISL
ncbi:MAG: NifU family protein [Bdellovibrionales bacterium]|nr:NifU family protein [Bdellovibrionales bacterium]